MSRNTLKLKELIFNILNNDMTLRGLLGGIGRVKHGNPQNLSQYPLVTYDFIGEIDEAYDSDQPSSITRTQIKVQSFTVGTSTKTVDAIDDRVFSLLHGQRISDGSVTVYSCYRTLKVPLYEPEVKVWNIISSFDLVNVIP